MVNEGFLESLEYPLAQVGTDIVHELFVTMKQRMRYNIDEHRKIKMTSASPSGYVPGALGRSIHFRVRTYNNKGGDKVRGFFEIGEGIPYAAVHDRGDAPTDIYASSGGFLVFFNHAPREGEPRWMRKKHVSRPGTPYFNEAVEYSLRKLGF